MANGYATPLLTGITAIAGTNPAKKLSPLGMLSMVLTSMDGSTQLLNSRDEMGHRRDLTVKYRKRVLESAVSDQGMNCDTGATPAYSEFGLPSFLNRTYQLWVPDSLIRQYLKDVSEFVTMNNGVPNIRKQTNAMKEVYDMFIEGGGAVLRSINKSLVTIMATQFGVNTVTGSNASRALSFELGTTGMNDAMVQLISDWRENEFNDSVMMVGNGAFANYDMIRQIMSSQASAQGISQASLANMIPKVYFDKDTRAVWGANQIGVFEKGSVHLLSRNDYAGNFGRTIANSTFFTMALPANEYNGIPVENLDKLLFDVQVKEFDCPQTLTINGLSTTTDGPGVLININKKYNLFTKPGNIYDAADPLFGTNGTLRYTLIGS
jgi:hypothetical protein